MQVVKEIFEARHSDPYKTADAVNHEGGKAWAMSSKSRVEQLAMTGTLGNSFYATAKETIEGALEVIEAADAKVLADAIVRGRNKGYVRAFNILALTRLRRKDPTLFKAVFNDVVKTGNDLKDFIDLNNRQGGFGRSVKTALHIWIEKNASEYYSLKYRNEIADAIRLSRFKGDDPIYRFILACYGESVVRRKAKKDGTRGRKMRISDANIEAAYEKYPKLKAGAEAMELLAKGGDMDKVAKLVSEFSLDVETLMAHADKFTPKVWDAVAGQTPTMRFLKYLAKFDREGVFERTGTAILSRKINMEALKRAKVFPFRLYVAYRNLTNPMLKNHLADTLNDYVGLCDWGAFNRQSWAVCPDVSGSMVSAIKDYKGRLTNLSCAAVAGMFTGFFYKGLKDCVVLPWDTQLQRGRVLPRGDTVLSHIEAMATAHGGGTHMETPVTHLIQKGQKVDNVLLITDNTEFGSGLYQTWLEYRKRVNPKARLFLLRIDQYSTQCYPDAAAEKAGIYQIFGWSDNVISFLEFVIS